MEDFRAPTPSQALCSACHSLFSAVSWFDKHRKGGVCTEPAELGLVKLQGLWATRERHAEIDAFRARVSGGKRL